jgi:type VI secretion system protein VasG
MKLCADPDTCPEPAALAEALHPELLKTFKPAFLGRVTLVPYYPLGDETMRKIVELQLGRIARRVKENHKAEFRFGAELVAGIASRCTEVSSGARNVDHILTRTLLPELSAEVLARMAEGSPIAAVEVSLGEDGAFKYTFS